MNDRVQIEITDGVADVRGVLPAKLNELDYAKYDAMIEARELL